MPSLRFTCYVAFIALLRLSVCAGQGKLSPNLDPPHFAQLKGSAAVRRSPSQGISPRYLFARSPMPQSECYSCEDSNGTPGCVAQGSDCCEGGGVCGPSQQCCWGVCISRTTDQCCRTPGTVCSDGYQCILMTYRSRFQSYQYPTCCTDTSCDDEDTLYVVDGYEKPRRPEAPTSTQVVYQTYTRTVTWTYWYMYYIYIEIRRTTLLTSERRTTVRVISVTATNSAEAEAEISASAEVLSLETPPQPMTETRGPTPPPSTTSQESESTISEEPTPPPTTRAPESDPVDSFGPDPSAGSDTPPLTPPRSRPPTSASNTLPDFELPEPTVNATDSDTTFPTGGSGNSAALSRFEGLPGLGGGILIVTFLFALMVAIL